MHFFGVLQTGPHRGTKMKLLLVFPKWILIASYFSTWNPVAKITTEHMTQGKSIQCGSFWEEDADGCLVGDPCSKHNAYRSRHMHCECKVLISPDSSCSTVCILWIPNTHGCWDQHLLPSLLAQELRGAWSIKLSLLIWTVSFKETFLWNKYFKHREN